MSGGRTIPVIADDYVDREFGTGALKARARGAERVREKTIPHGSGMEWKERALSFFLD